jgi:hypothetical protein
MLSWNTVANAAETVLFNAENYQAGAPVGIDLIIAKMTVVGVDIKYATGNNKQGSLLWPVNLPKSFEISAELYCRGNDANALINSQTRQCAVISLNSEMGTFMIKLTRSR